jgi:hypothetical protein
MVRPLIAALLAASSVACQHTAVPPPSNRNVPPVVTEYFDRLAAIYRAGSSPEDVAAFLALMAEDVHYVHVAYEAEFDLDTWRDAFLRNQQAGDYSEPAGFCLAITNAIPGIDHYAVEYASGMQSDGACLPSEARRLLIVFSVSDGKLMRIEELW